MTSTGFLYLCLIVIFTGVVNSSSDNSAQVYQIHPRTNISQHGNSKFGWLRFHTLDEIYDWLDGLQKKFPKNVQVIVAGVSTENRPIKGVHLKFSENKKAVFIEGGIHAREWLSHSTSTYLINKLLTSERPDIRQLAASYEWYIFPSVNPDGYVYTHKSPLISYRWWVKNRSKQTKHLCPGYSCQRNDCDGVNLNRNWNIQWGGKSEKFNDPCSPYYAGDFAFSEVETKSLSEYIDTIAHDLLAYISFNSHSKKLMYPYDYLIQDQKEILKRKNEQHFAALAAVKSLSKEYGTEFQVGSIEKLMKDANGSSVYWVKNKHHVPFVYLYPTLDNATAHSKGYGLEVLPSEIISVGKRVVNSIIALFSRANKRHS